MYSLASLPTEWHVWLEEHLNHASVIFERGYSSFIAAGEFAAFLLGLAAVLLAFCAIPRFAWGGSALSWCLLAMGVCLLARVQMGYWDRYLSATIQLIGYAQPLYFALPLLILGAVLRYSFVQQRLYRCENSEAETSNQI
ncbi:MAG: hypothetical protein M3Z22_01080 [Verrucomicrobiota bacterium]|nr:hypothetical protein [Verrucomicrobiota bacterium]